MKKVLLTLVVLSGAVIGRAQFTPMPLITLPIDFPGLVTGYTHIAVDANYAPTGTPSWGLVESIAVGRDASDMITSTLVTASPPMEILRANATEAAGIYTSVVEKYTTAWKLHQRETIYYNGTVDTARTLENYDTVAMVYNNTDHWSMTYDGSGMLTEQMHYQWVSGAWVLKDKRDFTYTGTEYATDTTYLLWGSPGGPIWHASKASQYFYVAGVLDSTALLTESTGVWTVQTTYHVTADVSGHINVIYNYYGTSSGGWALSSRSTFDNAPTKTTDAVKASEMRVFPVPVNNSLHVVAGSEYSDGSISIKNMAGAVVLTSTVSGNNTSVDVAAVAPGNYILCITKVGTPDIYRTITIAR